jgi:hypothetical protein
MKAENVVNWQPYWANLIMQNGCENKCGPLESLGFSLCVSLFITKKFAILASKSATLSAEFDHANKLGAERA